MFGTAQYLISIAEVRGFSVLANDVLSSDEREALTDFLAMNPIAGEVISDTDGVRLLKWPAASQGRSGVRVIYYFRDLNTPVYLLALYKKGERLILSASEKKLIRTHVADIVEAYRIRRAVAASSNGVA